MKNVIFLTNARYFNDGVRHMDVLLTAYDVADFLGYYYNSVVKRFNKMKLKCFNVGSCFGKRL